jgi:cytidylate kinase
MIVTIDGPAGAGKSSAAKALAERLGFRYLDTGAMYRAVTVAAMRSDLDFDEPDEVAILLDRIHIDMPPGKVILNGEDVTTEIRSPAVTEASGKAASCRAVRLKLVELQRAATQEQDFVCEGRDQGTIVFPDAEFKFFLTAEPLERAQRRHKQLSARGDNVSVEDVLAAQLARDKRDAERDIAPMKPAPDARTIDTSGMSLEQVVALMEQIVRGTK